MKVKIRPAITEKRSVMAIRIDCEKVGLTHAYITLEDGYPIYGEVDEENLPAIKQVEGVHRVHAFSSGGAAEGRARLSQQSERGAQGGPR